MPISKRLNYLKRQASRHDPASITGGRLAEEIARLVALPRPRQKVFTDGRQTPIDRNDRARIMQLAQVARRERKITRAAIDVLRALLFQFANLKDGRCFPSYEKIADAAGCCVKTVGRCIKALEAVNLITWVNRIKRIKERVAGLPGLWAATWRVKRTSNAYDFPLIAKARPDVSTKGQKDIRTPFQDSFSYICSTDPNELTDVERACLRLGRANGCI